MQIRRLFYSDCTCGGVGRDRPVEGDSVNHQRPLHHPSNYVPDQETPKKKKKYYTKLMTPGVDALL